MEPNCCICLRNDCFIDLVKGLMISPNFRVTLPKTSQLLLLRLSSDLGQPVTHRDLEIYIWGYSEYIYSNLVQLCVHRTRKLIELDYQHPKHIITVHRTGYLLRTKQ